MKKINLFMGMAAAVISLLGCTKENLNDNTLASGGDSFRIVVSTDDTKTTNDGMATVWAANDALTVFHAETGSTVYGSNDKFTVSAAGETTFNGTLTEALDDAKSYDWYMIYPYSNKYTTPANTTCYQQIANNITQNGYNSTAHLAGNKFPLVGKAKKVAAGTTPNIVMKQICAVIKVVVTNNTGEELTISSASVTSANVNLAGGYFINFAGDEPVIVDENVGHPENDKYMYKTVGLSVNGGTAIANGGTADLYFGVKPFVAKSETLKIAVNGYEKNLVIGAEEVAFKSGYIKTVNFNFDKAAEKLAEGNYAILAKRSSGNYWYMTNDLGTASTKRFQIEDSGLSALPENLTVSADKLWTVSKSGDGYIISTQEGKQIFWTSGNSAALADEGKVLTVNASTGGSFNVSFASSATETRTLALNATAGNNYFAFYTGSQEKDLFFIPATLSTTPTLTLNKTSIDDVVAAGVTDAQETGVYTLENAEDKDVTVTCDGAVVTAASVSGGALTYTVAANTGDARNGWVKLALAGQEAKTITVSQDAAGAGKETALDFTTKAAGHSAYNDSWDYGDWKVVYGANNNKGWGYVKMGGKSTTLANANPCYIYNTTAISHSVNKITVNIVAGSLSKSGMSVNSWGVYVYSDADMKTQVDYVAGGTITNAAASFDFVPSEGKTWAKNYYYKFSWDLANTTATNGIVCVEKITLYEK